MPDMNGLLLGLGQMGAAAGNRIMQERDRDREIAVQDRNYQLQVNQDKRAQDITNAQLEEFARIKAEREGEGLADFEWTKQGYQNPNFSSVFPEVDFTHRSHYYPDQKGGKQATAKGQTTGAPGAAFGAGTPAQDARMNRDLAKGESVPLLDHRLLSQRAEAFNAKVAQLQQEHKSFLEGVDYQNADPTTKAKIAGMNRRYAAQIQGLSQQAQQYHSQAEAARLLNISREASMWLLEGNMEKATPALQALGIDPSMFAGMKMTKDGAYYKLAGGATLTPEAIQAIVSGSPDDRIKALKNISDLMAKDRENAAKIASARAGQQLDPRLQAELTVYQLDKEYEAIKAQNPNDPRLKEIEKRVWNMKNSFNMDRSGDKALDRELKATTTDKTVAAKLLSTNSIATMSPILEGPLNWSVRKVLGIGDAPAAPAQEPVTVAPTTPPAGAAFTGGAAPVPPQARNFPDAAPSLNRSIPMSRAHKSSAPVQVFVNDKGDRIYWDGKAWVPFNG